LENLPNSLQSLGCKGNPIEFVDDVKYSDINFTLKGYQAIKRIQKRIRMRIRLKHQKLYLIEDLIEDWLWKPNHDFPPIQFQVGWQEIQDFQNI